MPYQRAICSMSLGRCSAGHSLPHKLDMAQKYNFQGIEIFHDDLLDIAKNLPGSSTPENQLAAARYIRALCDRRRLKIIAMQPFRQYEGLVDREEHRRRVEEMKLWMQLAQALGTDLILIPSSFLPEEEVSEDLDLIVQDLLEVAEMGMRQNPVIRFAYESLCWGTRVNTWQACWEVVQLVDRPNFGMCLDTFNIAAGVFADPALPSGKQAGCEVAMIKSLTELISTVDVDKIFFVQVADGERLLKPLVEGHPFYNPEQPALMSWSRNARLFYGEHSYGAYLPIAQVASAIFHGLGFEGWASLELFNRKMAETDRRVPEELARRGAHSWAKLARDMKLPVESNPLVMNGIQAML